jgi:hypothetical protein
VKIEALTPLNVTAVAPVKFVPVIVTLVPTGPLVGVKLAIVGAAMKLLALVAVPAAVVTLIGPVVTPVGAVATIAVTDVTVTLAALSPLNFTAVTPVKFVPLIVTLAPAGPLVGVKLVIVGGMRTVKLPALVPVPPAVVTESGPLVAAAGTAVWIDVPEVTVKVAALPLNATAVTPVKFVPLIVTLAPTSPLAGVKLVIVGGLNTVKLLALVAVPPDVATDTGPVVAPAGTPAWIDVVEVTVKVAAVPLNATAVTPVKFVPLIVTLAPTNPLAGVKLAIVGGLNTVKLLALVAVPPDVVTLNGPVVAPAGTEA